MNIALWIIQGLLALAFLGAGVPKLTQPIPTLAKRLPWAESFPLPLVRFIGLAEILGAIGLILPRALNIAPWLTGVAGIGLALVMLLSIGFHFMRNEANRIAPNIILMALAIVIAVGRLMQ